MLFMEIFMNALKAASFASLLVVTGVLLREQTVLPFLCNRKLVSEERALLDNVTRQDHRVVARAAQASLKRCTACLGKSADPAPWHVIAATNYRLLGRSDAAIHHYEMALRTVRNPELYLALGLLRVERGDKVRGLEDIVLALRYNPYLISRVPSPEIVEEVNRRLTQR